MTAAASQQAQEVADLVEQVGRAVHGDGYCAGLNPAQWAALRYFERANRFSRTVSAFAAFHGSTRGTASQTVKSLVGKGYLRREPIEGDRRSFRIDLTAPGRRLLARDPLRLLVEAASGLGPAERRALVEALDAMLERLLSQQGRGRFGACACCCHLQVDACPGRASGPHQCGLLQEPLTDADVGRICMNFRELTGAGRA